jgi:hypothetical protein
MSKKVLAIYYSQSGQLQEIIDNFCQPLIETGISVEKVNIELQNAHLLPWTAESFFSVMPDCVLGVPTEIEPFVLKEKSYDLIVLGYQAWFLSPSIPFNSFVHHPSVQQVLKDTAVITITGARNMWVNAFKGVKKILKESGARLVGNISLVDRHLNLVSFVTIFHWMLHNKKDRYLNIFPKPGVSDTDIANTKIFGEVVIPHLEKGEWSGLQAELMNRNAVDLKYHLMFIESKAGIMFKVWAKLIARKQNKAVWLAAFKYYLMTALFVAAPLVFVVDQLFFKPFLPKYIRRQKESLLNLS